MAHFEVILERQSEADESEAGWFLYCLANQLEIGHAPSRRPKGSGPSPPAPEVQAVAVRKAKSSETAAAILREAAAECDPEWQRFYRITGAGEADDDRSQWKGYAPLS
jgi:hypothetical protein